MHVDDTSDLGWWSKSPNSVLEQYLTGPDTLVDKASASGAGGRRFDSQCRRHWGSF